MASMNNWLAFSLSPKEFPSHTQTDVSGDCFDLSSDSTTPLNLPALRPDAPFGILEALDRTHQPHDWNVKDLGMNCDTNYKTSSEYSMLIGGGSSSHNHLDHEEPKLEDFLGNSFSDHQQKQLHHGCNPIPSMYHGTGDYMLSNCSLQLPAASVGRSDNGGGGISGGSLNNNSIGLSMIKTWLRNQPVSSQQENKNHGNTSGTAISNNAQTLSLSMSTGSQSSSPLPLLAAASGGGGVEISSSENKQKTATSLDNESGSIEAVPRKSIDTFGQRTSIYRGVTRHRWTGRYEAHLWDNSCRREGQTRKGRQVYLGGYDKEEKAARAYDLAALKYWGSTTTTNFPISNYEKELEEMKHMTRQEYVASLRRKSSGFSRGASIYRGVTRHHQHGRWQARIGRVAGNKDLYLGTFSTQEEAAEAYDIAAIKFRGLNAVTNFEMSRYDVNSIIESSTLPIGGAAKRLKEAEHAQANVDGMTDDDNITAQLTHGINYGIHHHGWPSISFQQAQPLSMNYPYSQPRGWCKQEPDEVAAHTFQDLPQLQYGNTHNFFQPNVVHNLMNLDSPTMEHSSGSNSVIYSSGGGGTGNGGSNGSFQGVVGGNNGAFVIPTGMAISEYQSKQNHGNSFGENEVKQFGYDNILASDPYQGRNAYYLSQQSSSGLMKTDGYDQGSCHNWMPTAAQALGPRMNNLAACNGTPTFTVWNDT